MRAASRDDNLLWNDSPFSAFPWRNNILKGECILEQLRPDLCRLDFPKTAGLKAVCVDGAHKVHKHRQRTRTPWNIEKRNCTKNKKSFFFDFFQLIFFSSPARETPRRPPAVASYTRLAVGARGPEATEAFGEHQGHLKSARIRKAVPVWHEDT